LGIPLGNAIEDSGVVSVAVKLREGGEHITLEELFLRGEFPFAMRSFPFSIFLLNKTCVLLQTTCLRSERWRLFCTA
jgi:hypothetical protein